MGVFPDRLVTSMYTRQHAARKVMREQNLFKPTPNDVVRVLGLTKENQGEKAAAFCQSLWKLPYEEQLKFKQERLMKQMKRLSEIVQQDILLPVIDEETNLFRGLTIYPMIPSPKTTGYRGKDGYMISYGIDGDPATVGMPYGKWLKEAPKNAVPTGFLRFRIPKALGYRPASDLPHDRQTSPRNDRSAFSRLSSIPRYALGRNSEQLFRRLRLQVRNGTIESSIGQDYAHRSISHLRSQAAYRRR